jgi:capsular exopolysaccharide family
MEVIQINKVEQEGKILEAYKSLRTNIQFCGSEVQVIALTSSRPDEGKSTTAFNLAESLAEVGKRVIYVDTDLRRSVFTGRFKINSKIWGQSHYLSGQCKLDEVVYATNVKNLFVTISGPEPPNPAELLSGLRFKGEIESFREIFDYVIIDTPPLGSVIDCAVIAPCCDGIVLVIESGGVNLKFVKSVKQQIERTKCPLLGVVLNKVNMSSRSGYYGAYNSYYGNT